VKPGLERNAQGLKTKGKPMTDEDKKREEKMAQQKLRLKSWR